MTSLPDPASESFPLPSDVAIWKDRARKAEKKVNELSRDLLAANVQLEIAVTERDAAMAQLHNAGLAR